MRKIVKSTNNFTKKDIINSRSAIPLQDECNPTANIGNVVECAQIEDTDEDTGEIKNVTVIKSICGEEEPIYYTSISETVYNTLPDVIDLLSDGPLDLRIDKRKAKSGRDFLSVTVL